MAGWRRYAGPVAFLAAVTVAVLLVRDGLEHGSSSPPARSVPTTIMTKETAPPPTTTVATKKPARRYWTVSPGDTFAVISAKTGVPVATIEQLNPSVRSTSLFIGEKLRIK